MARRGHTTTHFSTPISLAHTILLRDASRRWESRKYSDPNSGYQAVEPRSVVPAGLFANRLGQAELHRVIRLGWDAILIDQPLLFSDGLSDCGASLIYRPTDIYADPLKRHLQRRIIGASDGIVATSAAVLADLPPSSCPNMVLPNGVDLELFSGPDAKCNRPSTAVYVGALDERFDWEVLALLATSYSDWRFVIYGPHPQRIPHPLPPNVATPGPIPYTDVPKMLRQASIGLLPFAQLSLNEGRSPMKLFEYLASGLYVVGRDAASLDVGLGGGVYKYRSMDEALVAFGAAAAQELPNAAGESRAAVEGWGAKAEKLLRFMERL